MSVRTRKTTWRYVRLRKWWIAVPRSRSQPFACTPSERTLVPHFIARLHWIRKTWRINPNRRMKWLGPTMVWMLSPSTALPFMMYTTPLCCRTMCNVASGDVSHDLSFGESAAILWNCTTERICGHLVVKFGLWAFLGYIEDYHIATATWPSEQTINKLSFSKTTWTFISYSCSSPLFGKC